MSSAVSEAASQWSQSVSSWAESTSKSRRFQLALTAIISGSVVATAIFGYQRVSRERALRKFKDSLDIPEAHQDPVAQHINETLEDIRATDKSQDASSTSKGFEDVINHNITGTSPSLSKEDQRAAALAARARAGDYDEDLILEQLARNRVFLTDTGLSALRSSFIIVVGCGGVGSHATAALVRSGVSRIRLIDFDQVTLSSLNRHAVATLADVGTPKVLTLQRRLEQIAPWVQFDCRNELFGATTATTQLAPWSLTPNDSQAPTFVIDAIDNIDSKVALLAYCAKNSIRVISSMGAGCKSDPTRVFIGDISASAEDPLSRATRRRLRAEGVATGIPVVFSAEKPGPGKAALLPLPEEEFAKGSVGELGVLPDFRVRILPVLGTMPAVFGLCVANHVMLEIANYPREYLAAKSRDKMYDSILATLQGSEERLARWAEQDAVGLRVPVTQDDVGYIVEEVFRGKSVVSGLGSRLALVRWTWPEDTSTSDAGRKTVMDESVPGQKLARVKLRDLVCMTKDEAAKHEKSVLKEGKPASEVWGEHVVERVKRRQQEEIAYARFRE